MATTHYEYKCDNCPDGVVKMTVRKTKNSTNASVGNCNKCKKSFGFKSIGNLLPKEQAIEGTVETVS
jgi:predicted SprT family Zn-dependent metalloprotease